MKIFQNFCAVTFGRPDATALINGSEKYSDINGRVRFFQVPDGVLVCTEVSGLPQGARLCGHPVFGFHIHAGTACTGNTADPFADADGHYNPKRCPHPYHAGDMPPLFGVNGKAFSMFLTNRFTLNEVIGRAVIIHGSPDDFTTQPGGNAGEKIACGIIKR